MNTNRPRVAPCIHLYRYGRPTPCPAHLWTVTHDGKQATAPTWLAAMDLANTLARAGRPVEVKP